MSVRGNNIRKIINKLIDLELTQNDIISQRWKNKNSQGELYYGI